ncbi:hypothetical protein Kpol_1036p52 [Vanderwaltozyma polyspora DSM 70294]|uniref:Uncharacterized protein n=1 Tax=Vanderwaltozyma polyspora (strain ATCC 22028 / DSM 70294 / BCRC 21397 / CBS 2163 / NBRC 10782 / NRRL Y-8283 / UCD 57-17) TaxID=436907 RepID=A7TEK0_VANPO|nr:uncharacterized protein Kpol_1036p52 [Vanderwaltozyma polyspora DSM 70294]EDO19307.1 hypothetical protein Kpol_1036p52 [Vanderwaltozyma polyspora DSM 70294]
MADVEGPYMNQEQNPKRTKSNQDEAILIDSDLDDHLDFSDGSDSDILQLDGRTQDIAHNSSNGEVVESVDISNRNERYDEHTETAVQISNSGNDSANNDDITIVREINRSPRRERRNESVTEYVDLDHEPEDVEPIGTSNLDGRSSGSNVNDRDRNNSNIDDLIIISEQHPQPSANSIFLTIPGRQLMELQVASTDIPTRSSFEYQNDRRPVRLGNSGRPRINRQYMQNSFSRVRRQLLGILRVRQSNPEIDEIAREISLYHTNIRSAFIHANSFNEFMAIIEVAPRLGITDDLVDLYLRLEDLRNRTHQANSLFVPDIDNISSNSETTRYDEGWNPVTHPVTNRFIEDSFHSPMIRRIFGNYGGRHHQDYDDDDEEGRTQSIITMIQEREEVEKDLRTKKYSESTKEKQDEFERRATELPDGYSSSFNTEPKAKVDMTKNGVNGSVSVVDDTMAEDWEEIPICCLCGVTLSEGIPDEFQGMSNEDRFLPFEELKEKYDSFCPYQCLIRPSQSDRDFSKRVYVANCGHTYCGRCYRRIQNSKEKSKLPKSQLAKLKGACHPDNYGPKKCPVTSCNRLLRISRGVAFREAYF